jgi:SAF domain
MRGRREVPYLVLGIALVVVGALGAVLLMSRAGQQVDALVLTRDVAVGQPLAAGDLRLEPVLAGSSVPVVPAGEAASVVGRVAATPLRAGHLLAPDDVGAAAWPPADQVLLAVAVPPGSYPPELAAGMHVLVATGSPDGAEAAAASSDAAVAQRDGLAGTPEAVVAAVRPNPNGTGGSVVSLLLSRAGAGSVTAAPASRLRLVVVPAPTPTAAAGSASPTGGG